MILCGREVVPHFMRPAAREQTKGRGETKNRNRRKTGADEKRVLAVEKFIYYCPEWSGWNRKSRHKAKGNKEKDKRNREHTAV